MKSISEVNVRNLIFAQFDPFEISMELLYSIGQLKLMEEKSNKCTLTAVIGNLPHLQRKQDNLMYSPAARETPKLLHNFAKLSKKSSQIELKLSHKQRSIKCFHLTKKENKIEMNINQHPTFGSTKKTLRMISNSTYKPNFINHLEYTSYFTPKTKEQILRKNRKSLNSNSPLRQKQKHNKCSMISLKLQDNTFNQIQLAHLVDYSLKNANSFKSSGMQKSQNNLITPESKVQNIQSKSTSFYTLCNFPQQKLFNKSKKIINSDKNCQFPWEKLISSFTKHELQCYFKSLLQFCKRDQSKYANGFETMLNLMNISANQKIINQWLDIFIQKPTFSQFVYVFSQIITSALKESVIDYFEIVFQNYKQHQIGYDDLIKLLSERMSEGQASDIVDEIFYVLEKDGSSNVGVKQISDLCFNNQDFCNFMRQFKLIQQIGK